MTAAAVGTMLRRLEDHCMRTTISAALLAASAAVAQTPPAPADFPADAKELTADALRQRVSGKVFRVAVANGNVWRLQFDGNGYYFINVAPSNYSDSGKWRVEESALCFEPTKTKAGCNPMRLVGELVYFKRDNGEVVKLEPT
jgi:hypothetical protein